VNEEENKVGQTMRHRKRKNRGGAMVEFALLCPVWLTLLLGTMWYGTAMIRGLMVTQTARDLASMYCRAVDFSATDANSAQVNILPKLVRELGTITTTGGTGVAIFSQLTYVGADICKMAGVPTYSDGVTPTGNCKNWQKFVFTQRYTVGTASLLASILGNPASGDPDSTKQYKIPLTTYVSNAADALSTNFNLLPNPDTHPGGYKSGQPVYVVEVFFPGTSSPGYGGGHAYAYAIF
jgi:Flp pilus assembly protein TadG